MKGFDTAATSLACYSGAAFDPELRDAAAAYPPVQLGGLALYGMSAV